MAEKQKYILDDDILMQRNSYTGRPQGRFPDNGGKSLEDWFGPKGKWLGHALCVQPYEMFTKINPTTPPGMLAGLWMGLLIQLRKWEYNGVKKMSETIEVTPAYAQYYHITLQQKEEIEGKIKAGLQSVSQSIADLELLKHDERKYREFLDYFGLAFNPDKEEAEAWTKDDKKVDDHALRSVFIDQVDAHTGEGIAMRNIVSRWPTLITDFMRMGGETDVEKLRESLDVSRAESVVLSSKNRLYQEWKKLFEPELKSRYMKIRELVASRDASIVSYRNWVKPLIRRHKMLAEGLEGENVHNYDRDIYFYSHSQAFAHNDVKVWAWRFYTTTEFYRAAGSERLATEQLEKIIEPYDEWTKKNLVFNKDYGLIRKFPWLTEKWVEDTKNKIIDTNADLMVPRKSYYAFFILRMSKTNGRFASGEEFEDADFYIHGIFMSQNVLLVKLLEMYAQEKEFDDYVDTLLGIGKSQTSTKEAEKKTEERVGAMFRKINGKLESAGMLFQFMKPMPYEKDFDERIGKLHARGMAKERFIPIVNYIKSKVGIGK